MHPRTPPSRVIVHVVAEAAVLDSAEASATSGERPEDNTTELIATKERMAEIIKEAFTPKPAPAVRTQPCRAGASGLVLGGTTIPAAVLADLLPAESPNCGR